MGLTTATSPQEYDLINIYKSGMNWVVSDAHGHDQTIDISVREPVQ